MPPLRRARRPAVSRTARCMTPRSASASVAGSCATRAQCAQRQRRVCGERGRIAVVRAGPALEGGDHAGIRRGDQRGDSASRPRHERAALVGDQQAGAPERLERIRELLQAGQVEGHAEHAQQAAVGGRHPRRLRDHEWLADRRADVCARQVGSLGRQCAREPVAVREVLPERRRLGGRDGHHRPGRGRDPGAVGVVGRCAELGEEVGGVGLVGRAERARRQRGGQRRAPGERDQDVGTGAQRQVEVARTGACARAQPAIDLLAHGGAPEQERGGRQRAKDGEAGDGIQPDE